ncbi:MAG TPA: hypothetical protein VLI92_02555 [Candidatus Saccharimonadales bacterium]|nr:hypothetical protein [Candidatus Saccharimonadales bacterium]
MNRRIKLGERQFFGRLMAIAACAGITGLCWVTQEQHYFPAGARLLIGVLGYVIVCYYLEHTNDPDVRPIFIFIAADAAIVPLIGGYLYYQFSNLDMVSIVAGGVAWMHFFTAGVLLFPGKTWLTPFTRIFVQRKHITEFNL